MPGSIHCVSHGGADAQPAITLCCRPAHMLITIDQVAASSAGSVFIVLRLPLRCNSTSLARSPTAATVSFSCSFVTPNFPLHSLSEASF